MAWTPEEKVIRMQKRNATMARLRAEGKVYGKRGPRKNKEQSFPLDAIGPDVRPGKQGKGAVPTGVAVMVVLPNGVSVTVAEARTIYQALRQLFK